VCDCVWRPSANVLVSLYSFRRAEAWGDEEKGTDDWTTRGLDGISDLSAVADLVFISQVDNYIPSGLFCARTYIRRSEWHTRYGCPLVLVVNGLADEAVIMRAGLVLAVADVVNNATVTLSKSHHYKRWPIHSAALRVTYDKWCAYARGRSRRTAFAAPCSFRCRCEAVASASRPAPYQAAWAVKG